jgi:hypothetical protein
MCSPAELYLQGDEEDVKREESEEDEDADITHEMPPSPCRPHVEDEGVSIDTDPAEVEDETAEPHKRTAPRKISWGDDNGKRFIQSIDFHKDDEAWRCSKYRCGPLALSTYAGSEAFATILNGKLPSTAPEVIHCLATKGVQLESVQAIASQIFL